ncbi:MAG TPA: hypothetical protein VIU11_09835 [Nakamurella sp.]
MLLRKVASNPVWHAVAAEQGGLISRRQLLELGLTRSVAATNVDNGRWQRVHLGVYATFTGTISPEQEVWAALLYAGRGAAACCSTALWLFGVIDQKPDALHISIPEARRVERLPDVRMHRRRALNRRDTPVHPAAAPPRIRIEESLLDECATLPEADVVGLILRAIQRRKTTPGRIEGAISARSSQPRRALLRDLLAEAEEGVASPLELHYRRRVEVPHRLPIGRRNLLDVTVSGRKRYRDVEYERWRLIVELDGQEAHPPDQAFRDMRRDNETTLTGRDVLRFGWRDVVGEPCVAAAQVALALQQRGWPESIGRCGPDCSIPPAANGG